jgi:hypothetical protein
MIVNFRVGMVYPLIVLLCPDFVEVATKLRCTAGNIAFIKEDFYSMSLKIEEFVLRRLIVREGRLQGLRTLEVESTFLH